MFKMFIITGVFPDNVFEQVNSVLCYITSTVTLDIAFIYFISLFIYVFNVVIQYSYFNNKNIYQPISLWYQTMS